MKHSWSHTVFPIAALFSFRMLGLFLLIPVFTLYAGDLSGATPALVGLALGCYGLTQGLLQMPFGMLSDKIGRKPVITLGLILFAIGSVVGALSHSIYGMLLARMLQGTGAIGSVLIALLADLTPDQQRTKAMAVIGMTIGTSFSLAMVLSPALSSRYGLAGIFYLTALLALLGLILLHWVIPTPKKERFHSDSETNPVLLQRVLVDGQLQRLNLGIFCQHFMLTATFFAIPMVLQQHMQQGHLTQQWHFYLPLMVASFLCMIPFIIVAEKKRGMRGVFLGAVLCTAVTQGLLAYTYVHWLVLCALMFAYFIGFNILEASLPSLVSKQAHPNQKGTAMGVYSTSQFLGIFAGGALAGVLYQWGGSPLIFAGNAVVSAAWLFIAYSMKPNNYLTTLILPFQCEENDAAQVTKALMDVQGVQEVAHAPDEEVVYLRIDKAVYLQGSAEKVLSAFYSL